jgi:hypothetical protein
MSVVSRSWAWLPWERVIEMSDLGGAMGQDLSMYMEFKFSLGPLVNAGIFMRHGYSRGPRRPDVI